MTRSSDLELELSHRSLKIHPCERPDDVRSRADVKPTILIITTRLQYNLFAIDTPSEVGTDRKGSIELQAAVINS